VKIGVFEKLSAGRFLRNRPQKARYRDDHGRLPVVLSIVRMCCTKLSCLFDVVAQKSLAVICKVVGLLLALFVSKAHAAFFAERRLANT